ncbi:tRNA pseudouridine synthase A [Candidatus Phytoplasma luffae]|uniref:tRNA pseudouridine synthase A n=1 Tax=Loofah witches'-broom phytoplasma TaxID=35773 RepID=A0A975FI55_LOWBP|nr:tRNA pseudouridine(38-40) synthase TruA [Candidatus Phytoplasma luffae]QTX02808.1 tRNA pseudouridine synthase A [Candidatus Phytoplasma luffae]
MNKNIIYKLILVYDGANYYGYQKQPNLITIQSVLENALFKVTKRKIKTIAASRTDKGVHSEGQVVSFQTDFRIPPYNLKKALNKIISQDILVLDICICDFPFHARYNSKSKIYRYVFSKKKLNPFNCRFQVYFEKLNFSLIKEAIHLLEGQKDFVLFTNNKDKKKNTIKTIYKVFVEENENQFVIFFHGKGFLKQMILLLVGFLINIAQGKKTLSELENMFLIKNNKKFTFIAPSNGLFLKNIFY